MSNQIDDLLFNIRLNKRLCKVIGNLKISILKFLNCGSLYCTQRSNLREKANILDII
jgi:hypothetical protein